MKVEIIEFSELTDSREMLEAREPHFMIISIYLVLLLLVIAFIWMWFAEIDTIVKADGVIRPTKNISVILNINTGKIKKKNYQEGVMVEKGDILYEIDSTLYDLERNSIVEKKEKIENEIKMFTLLEDSYRTGVNPFDQDHQDHQEYYNRYLSYKYTCEQLQLDYSLAQKHLIREKSLDPRFTTKSKLEQLQYESELARLNLQKYISDSFVAIQNETKAKRDTLTQLEEELNNINEMLNLCKVKSPITGYVQEISVFNVNDYMPSSVEVLRIIPDTYGYEAELIVKNKDISQIKIGQNLKYHIAALPYREYGTLDGVITKISKDTISAQKDYRIIASINDTKLYDHKGEEGQIKAGMLVEAHIVVRKRRVLHFLLEKLELL